MLALLRRSKMRIEGASSFHHLLLLLLISCSYFQYYYSEGCHEGERRALLHIKGAINNTDSYKLSTWVGKECCKWDGIECDNSSSRVVRLDIPGDVMDGNGTEILQAVCQFNLIEYLNVANNSLKGVVPPCLGNHTSLTYLNLAWNKFQGNIPSLNRLSALETIHMMHNQFQGNILHLFGENHPIRMRDISNFSNATMSPPWKKLRWLSLGYNELTGDGWDFAQVVCHLNLLEHLNVRSNSLEGVVPPCLGNLTSLTFLDLSLNKFHGNIPSLSRLNALETLDLSNNQFQGNILHLFGENHPIRMRDASNFSNATISAPWKKLQYLDVGANELTGDGWDFAQVVCHLNFLEVLDVKSNSLEGVVPPCLGNLTSLTFLDLEWNKFQGSIPSLSHLSALETLDLSNNQFQGNILQLIGENHPIGIRDASNFSNATISPPWKKLQYLDVGANELTGDGWDFAQVVCHLNLLELLNVHSNSLEGVVPPCLGNLTSLTFLDLSLNKFHGNIPSLSRLNALEMLDLSNNQFQGNILHLFGENHPIGMRDASNLSNATISPPWKKLYWLDLGDNELTGDIWDLAQVVCHLNLLELLDIYSNSLEGVVPPCLGNLTSLIYLDLSDNNFQGNIPSLSHLNALETLDLSYNQFQGNILDLFGENHSFGLRDASNFSNATISPPWKKLYLGFNELTGDGWDLAQAICQLKSLEILSLSHNSLEGRLHRFLGMMHSIFVLDLSYNRFQGNVSPIFDGFNMNKSSLQYLDLSSNGLEGDILARDSNMSELRVLKLQNNRFTRLTTLPRHLILADLSHNHLSGDTYSASLPLPHLRILLLRGNHLEGKIPKQLCEMESLQFFDLSNNNLSGKIPSCLNNISSMRDKYRQSHEGPIVIEVTKGPLTHVGNTTLKIGNTTVTADFTTKGNSYTFEGDPLYFFTGIDLSCNQLTGGIPSTIGDLRNLHALNLSNNRLTGALPASFQNMENIESLDLSCNELSGGLPLQLTQLLSLSVFNVSFNNLSGSIPYNHQFSTFKNESFMGNVGLCGLQVERKCSTNTTLGHNPPQPNFIDEDGAASLIENRLFFYSWVAISYALGLWVVIGLLIFNKKWRQKYFRTIDECIYMSQEKFWVSLNYFKVCN